jgi:hypothetical protein
MNSLLMRGNACKQSVQYRRTPSGTQKMKIFFLFFPLCNIVQKLTYITDRLAEGF